MFNSTRKGGKHRKQSPNKGRVAMVAVTTGAVSTAGLSGAAAADLVSGKNSSGSVEIKLAADVDELDTAEASVAGEAAEASAAATASVAPASAAGAEGETEGEAGAATPATTTTTTAPAPAAAAAAAEQAPQILAIAEYKPVENLADQLVKAVEHSAEVAAADLAARLPFTVKPAEGAFTSGFGPRWGTIHNGIDIANANGTPILAVEDGTVIDSGPAQGFGNWIRIQHDDGAVSVYGHMQTLDVSVGQRVTAGQRIAGMGNTGFSTGTHLHFEIYQDGITPIDPVPWLAARGVFL